jgi:hypothetical protein
MDMGGNVDEVTFDIQHHLYIIKGGSYIIGSGPATKALIHQFECAHELPVNPNFLGMADGLRIVVRK